MFYKFVNSRYVDLFTGGSLRFGSLSYFRLLEAVTGDSFIGDEREGVNVDRLHDVVINSNETSELRRSLDEQGVIRIVGGGSVTINADVTTFVDGYVFCFSQSDSGDLQPAMLASFGEGHVYDACVKINDPDALKNVIEQYGMINDVPVAENFSVHIGGVVYEDDSDVTPVRIGSPNPFRKRSIYRPQQEVRVFLRPKNALFLRGNGFVRTDFVTVRLRDLDGILSTEFRRIPAGPTHLEQAPSGEFSATDLWTIMRAMATGPNIDSFDHFDREARDRRHQEIAGETAHRRPTIAKLYWKLRQAHGCQFFRMDQAILMGFLDSWM